MRTCHQHVEIIDDGSVSSTKLFTLTVYALLFLLATKLNNPTF